MNVHGGSLDHAYIVAHASNVRAAALSFDGMNEAVPQGHPSLDPQLTSALGTAASPPTTKNRAVGGHSPNENQVAIAADVLVFEKKAVPKGQTSADTQPSCALGTAASLPTTKNRAVGGHAERETHGRSAADVLAVGEVGR